MNAKFAVIFTAELTDVLDGYDLAAARMRELVTQQPGFEGIESVTEGRREITVSYWSSEAAIRDWKAHPEHRAAQANGRERWYRWYRVEVVRLERAYASKA